MVAMATAGQRTGSWPRNSEGVKKNILGYEGCQLAGVGWAQMSLALVPTARDKDIFLPANSYMLSEEQLQEPMEKLATLRENEDGTKKKRKDGWVGLDSQQTTLNGTVKYVHGNASARSQRTFVSYKHFALAERWHSKELEAPA